MLTDCRFVFVRAVRSWGLITFSETSLLVHPQDGSQSGRQYAAWVIAHEIGLFAPFCPSRNPRSRAHVLWSQLLTRSFASLRCAQPISGSATFAR